MGFINQFPYSDFHELNIDWILKQIKEDEAQIEYLKEEFAKIEVVTEEHIKEMIQYAISTNNIELRAEMVALKETITNFRSSSLEYMLITRMFIMILYLKIMLIPP